MVRIQKFDNTLSVRVLGSVHFPILLVGVQNAHVLMAGKLAISDKITCIFHLEIPLLGFVPNIQTKIRKKVCMKLFITTFFILSKDWKEQ